MLMLTHAYLMYLNLTHTKKFVTLLSKAEEDMEHPSHRDFQMLCVARQEQVVHGPLWVLAGSQARARHRKDF